MPVAAELGATPVGDAKCAFDDKSRIQRIQPLLTYKNAKRCIWERTEFFRIAALPILRRCKGAVATATLPHRSGEEKVFCETSQRRKR
uniref:Uncharacterized protein n=1 Tax=Trichuris muris TaxID=70415 RepID=A0A5S6Q5W8_TRIMR